MTLTEEVMQAVFVATEERKALALRALKGEIPADGGARAEVIGPLLLGMGAAARFLGVSRATLWRILQAGKVGKVELFPGSYRMRKADLVALAAGAFGESGKVSRRGRPRKVTVGQGEVARG